MLNRMCENFMKQLTVLGESHWPKLLLTHGAGAGCDSAFMQQMAKALVNQNIQVGLYNFPYMQKRLELGTKRPPDRVNKLIPALVEAITSFDCQFVAGKSMGGRMATMLSNEITIKRAFALGYPFFKPKDDSFERLEHFLDCKYPIDIFHGTRDKFGKPEQLPESLPYFTQHIHMHWLTDADHDFVTLKKSTLNQQDHILAVAKKISSIIHGAS